MPPLLFDLRKDPGELHNLAGDPALADVAFECAERSLSGYRITRDGLLDTRGPRRSGRPMGSGHGEESQS